MRFIEDDDDSARMSDEDPKVSEVGHAGVSTLAVDGSMLMLDIVDVYIYHNSLSKCFAEMHFVICLVGVY